MKHKKDKHTQEQVEANETEVVSEPQVDQVEATETPKEIETICSELQAEKDQLFNRLQRSHADFQNYQKKAIKDRQESVDRIELNTIERFLLPMIDDLDRALKAADDHGYKQDDPLFAGVKLVRDQMISQLKQIGIEPIVAEGKAFDPLYHEALMEVPTDDIPENSIVYAMNRGYTQNGKTFRPVRVAIAKAIAKEEEVGDENNNETNNEPL
jgi:molecular chaperone GrpE